MSLIKSKSKKAMSENISTEMHAGKPQKQAIAIAYSVQRKAKKPKKYADGGEVTKQMTFGDDEGLNMSNEDIDRAKSKRDYHGGEESGESKEHEQYESPSQEESEHKDEYATGGYVRGHYNKHKMGSMNPKLAESKKDPMSDVEEHYKSIADAILAEKRKHKFAEGGEVEYNTGHPEEHRDDMADIDWNGEEHPNAYYRRNEDEILKENYDSDFLGLEQPRDSNEHGDNIPSDEHDMVEAIRKKMKYKRSDLG